MTDETQAPASRETDAAVARAMGYRIWIDSLGTYSMNNSDYNWKAIPPYSAETPDGYAAMASVLAWIESLGWRPCMDHFSELSWEATGVCGKEQIDRIGESLPLAVCRLALAVAKAGA
jgi:hypothetical protein